MIKITTITEFDSPIYKKALPLVVQPGTNKGAFLIIIPLITGNENDFISIRYEALTHPEKLGLF